MHAYMHSSLYTCNCIVLYSSFFSENKKNVNVIRMNKIQVVKLNSVRSIVCIVSDYLISKFCTSIFLLLLIFKVVYVLRFCFCPKAI